MVKEICNYVNGKTRCKTWIIPVPAFHDAVLKGTYFGLTVTVCAKKRGCTNQDAASFLRIRT
jgi:hypothetical protein